MQESLHFICIWLNDRNGCYTWIIINMPHIQHKYDIMLKYVMLRHICSAYKAEKCQDISEKSILRWLFVVKCYHNYVNVRILKSSQYLCESICLFFESRISAYADICRQHNIACQVFIHHFISKFQGRKWLLE